VVEAVGTKQPGRKRNGNGTTCSGRDDFAGGRPFVDIYHSVFCFL